MRRAMSVRRGRATYLPDNKSTLCHPGIHARTQTYGVCSAVAAVLLSLSAVGLSHTCTHLCIKHISRAEHTF